MFVTFINFFFSGHKSTLTTIEILVLSSWIPASKEFLLKKLVSRKFFKESVLCSVEKGEIHSHQKIFREFNSLVTYLVEIVISRKFCQKSVRERISVIFTTWWINFRENVDWCKRHGVFM